MSETTWQTPPPSYAILYPDIGDETDVSENDRNTNDPVDPGKVSELVVTLLQLQEAPHRTYFSKRKVWPEGEGCYYGELDWKGRRAGAGRMVWGAGSRVYAGHWVKNRMEGEGVIWWEGTGTYYSGGWRKGLVHGRGRLVYGPRSDTPGDVYEGDFR